MAAKKSKKTTKKRIVKRQSASSELVKKVKKAVDAACSVSHEKYSAASKKNFVADILYFQRNGQGGCITDYLIGIAGKDSW
jgi:hypothetical protein